MRVLALVALCSSQAAAFSLSSPAIGLRSAKAARSVAGPRHSRPLPLAAGGQQRCAVRAPAGAGALSMSADIDVKEYIKIFGRLGEKMIFGDASAGLCCHSACENCEWRYSFDVMQSARPKWIPTYRENRFEDGREHIAKWSGLFEDGDAPVNKEQFCERLAALKFDMPLGPAGFLTAKQADVSEEAMSAFWEYISRGKPTLSPKQMQIRLTKMLEDPTGAEGVMWPDFIDCLTADDEVAEDLDEAIVVA